MTRPRSTARATALVAVAAIALALSIPGSDIDATGWAPNVRKGSDIVMSELRWPVFDRGTYYCFWYMKFFPEQYCTFYGGLATKGPMKPAGMFMSYWGGITNIHEGVHFYRHGYGAEGAKGGANGRPPFLRAGSWYRVVMRVFPPTRGADKKTYVGWWIKDVGKNEWYTHSVVSIAARATGFSGNSGFVEALAPESVKRAFERRLGYCRLNGQWHKTDTVSSQSPSQFKLIEQGTVMRFDRPVPGDKGKQKAQKAKSSVTTKQPDTPALDPPAVEGAEARVWGNQVSVKWEVPRSAPPQLGYRIEAFARRGAKGDLLATVENSAPQVHARRLDTDRPPGSVRLIVTDIFDQRKTVVIPVGKATPAPAARAPKLRGGLRYAYYEAQGGDQWERLPDLPALKPVRQGCVKALDDTVRQARDKLYALRYTGYVRAPATGLYVFELGTCDGSRMSIGGRPVADNDGIHGTSVGHYPVTLSKGLHAFELSYFKGPGKYLADKILAAWEGPGFELRELSPGDFMCTDSADLPAIGLAMKGHTPGEVLADNLVEIRPEIERRGHRIDKVQFFRGRQLLESTTVTDPADTGRMAFRNLLPEGDNEVWARLWYDGGFSVDSNVLALEARNLAEGPWQFDVLGEKVFPIAVRSKDGRTAFRGDGFCFGHQRVSGDFTLTARIADIGLTTKENGIHASNWLGLYVKDKLGDPYGGSCFGIYRTAGKGMRGVSDFPDLGGSRLSVPKFREDHPWLRLVRRGSRFQAYTSADGKAWERAAERITRRFRKDAYAGMVFRAVPGKSRSLFHGALEDVTFEPGRVPEEVRQKPRKEDLPRRGRVTALVQAEKDPKVLYARTNGAGLLKSTDRGQTWRSANAGLNGPDALAVRSVAVHPKDSSVVLRGGGSIVNGELKSGLYRSTDGGRSWRSATRAIDFDGRGPTSIFGEVIAFSPLNPNFVAAAGETAGVFTSTDAGKTWKYAGLKGERVTCMAFSPQLRYGRDHVIVVGTFADSEFATLGLGKPVSQVNTPGRVYWASIGDGKLKAGVSLEVADLGVTNVLFGMHQNFATLTSTRGVYYTWMHGISFSQRLHDMPTDMLFTAIAGRRHTGWTKIIYAAPFSPEEQGPVYSSKDRSRTWSALSRSARVDGGAASLGAGISCIVRDKDEKNTLFLCNRHGIFRSTDHGKSYRLVYRSSPGRSLRR
ncbi:MAG: PA14 domain-containing protein [Planctomycetota bacterium]